MHPELSGIPDLKGRTDVKQNADKLKSSIIDLIKNREYKNAAEAANSVNTVPEFRYYRHTSDWAAFSAHLRLFLDVKKYSVSRIVPVDGRLIKAGTGSRRKKDLVVIADNGRNETSDGEPLDSKTEFVEV